MKKIFLFALAIIMTAAATVFAGGLPAEEDTSSLTAEAPSVGKTVDSGALGSIEIYPEQNAVLKLKADKAAGYTWEIAEPWDEKVLEFVGKETLSGASAEALGIEVWTFKGLKAGTIELSFRYVDQTGQSSPESKNAVFSVIVKEGTAGKTGPVVDDQAELNITGTVDSIVFSGDVTRVNPMLTLKKDDGEKIEFDVKPLCFVYRGKGEQASIKEISKGTRVTVNYRVDGEGVSEAVMIRIE
jgi:predicted secreted protein